MKRLVLSITAILLIGVMSCSKLYKNEKSDKKSSETVNTRVSSNQKMEKTYEAEMMERMEVLKKEVKPALESGVIANMNNATQKLGEAWEMEMRKVYDLLLSELSENEKIKLQKEQEEWAKKIKEKIAKDNKKSEGEIIETLSISGTALGNTEKRALELAKRYDQLHVKNNIYK